jgi:ubiquinone biosynthesis monooxygenase Coq7
MLSFALAHGVTEAEHLKQIEHWIPASQRSRLWGPRRLAGWLTGALPAVFGRRAVYGTIAAVETFVDQHYQQQIDHLQAFGGPEGLLPLLIRCQADERHHRDESAALAGASPICFCELGAGLSVVVLLLQWCWLVASKQWQVNSKR